MAQRYGDGNYPSLSLNNELLKAPTRKRKPDMERGGVTVGRAPRVVKMTFDVDTDAALMMNNVSMLEAMEEDDDDDEEEDNDEIAEFITPQLPTTEAMPPAAPKVTVLTNPQLYGDSGGLTSLQGISSLHGAEHHYGYVLRKLQASTRPSHDLWDTVSDEIMLSIFSWLPKFVLVRCARVSKRWHTLAMDESLWKRVDLGGKVVKKGVVGRILDRGTLVLRLAKSEIQTPLYSDSTAFSLRTWRVEYLDLSMAVISTAGLEQLLARSQNLRKLSLENAKLTDNVLRYIGQNKDLEVLNLCMCQGITENGLVYVCNSLTRQREFPEQYKHKLEALNVAWTNMSRGALLYLVICLPPTLTKLNLSGCRESLLDEDVQQLCRSCPNLKELDLSDSTVLTAASIDQITASLRGLEYIALSRCYHILPSSLPMLSHIVTLLALDVFGMLKETALAQLREAMPNIRINKFPFSSIARPTTGIRRTSLWGLRVRDQCL